LKCLAWAGTLAREEGVAEINERHLLLAVLSQTDGVTARVFSDLGLDVTAWQPCAAVKRLMWLTRSTLAPDAFEIMRLAQVEACNNGYGPVETPYFIIGFEPVQGRQICQRPAGNRRGY
jgi:ATP-dependent Clp protease ATP-binding subunit ClpA